MAKNLPALSADVVESGSLNLPKPYRPHRPVMGLLYLLNSIGIYGYKFIMPPVDTA
jgi:hypothetical protein